MALYLSTLSFAFGANVYFYSNTAMEAGGAIYVDKNYNNLRLVDGAYLLPCFYRILRVTTSDWLNISFYNNSATKGRNDIYGEFMHSGGCDTGDDTNRYSIVVPSCNVQTFFHYHANSISSVSSDPVQVCMCNNGHQLCNELYAEIIAYPGETFTLTVVVGADFGVTIGSVHTVFEIPITTVQLKPSSQYVQGMRTIDDGVCSELYYTIFSENTYEIFLLATQQESWNAIVEQQSYSYRYYDEMCSNIENYVKLKLL